MGTGWVEDCEEEVALFDADHGGLYVIDGGALVDLMMLAMLMVKLKSGSRLLKRGWPSHLAKTATLALAS